MIMKSDINKFVCILFVHLSSISLKNFKDRALIIPEILELITLHTYILIKKYLKYTLHALKIPMPSKRDTITIFTRRFMYKVDIKQITPTSKLFINVLVRGS